MEIDSNLSTHSLELHPGTDFLRTAHDYLGRYYGEKRTYTVHQRRTLRVQFGVTLHCFIFTSHRELNVRHKIMFLKIVSMEYFYHS